MPRALRPHQGALVLALAHLLLGAWRSSGWVFSKYPNLARGLASGELTPAQAGDASPLYLLLNTLASPQALRWLQLLAAALAVGALFATLLRTRGPLAAWAGAGALALADPFCAYGAVLEPDLLLGAALLGAGCCLALRARAGALDPVDPPAIGGLVERVEGPRPAGGLATSGPGALVEAHQRAGEAGQRLLFAAAALLGLAAALRPTTLLLGGLAAAWLVVAKTPWRSLALALVLAAGFAAGPALLLHQRLGQDLRATMSAGQVFHQSHRPESVGFGAVFPSLLKLVEAQASAEPHPPDYAHTLYRELARASEPSLTDGQTELAWAAQALAFLREEPAAALRQQLQKAAFFLAPPVGEYDIPAARQLLERPVGLPLRALTLLGAGSLALLLFRRERRALVWGLQWLAALVVSQLFYFHGRYAVSLVPALAALCGLGAAELWELWRGAWSPAADGGESGAAAAPGASSASRGARRRFALALAILAAPAMVLAVPQVRWGDRIVERTGALARAAEAGAGARSWEQAFDAYVEQQAAMPDLFWPSAPGGAGMETDEAATAQLAADRAQRTWGASGPVDATLLIALWAAAGRCDLVLPLASQLEDSGFSWSNGDCVIDPRVVASDCLLEAGDRTGAARQLEAADARAPGRLEVLARLIAAGDTGTATDLSKYERQLYAFHDAPSAHAALARARRRWGDSQGALGDADWLLAHWPRAAPFAQFERALALEATGRPEQAAEAWRASLVLRAPLHGLQALDSLADGLAGSEPAAALRHFRLRGNRRRVQRLLAEHPELAAPHG